MPLESPIAYIPDLNPANPVVSDGLVQGDDHLRGIKAALKNTFPNFTGAALQATQAELDSMTHTGQLSAQDGAAGTPSHTFRNDTTAGFYKGARGGQTAISGTLRGAGTVPVGAIVDFPKLPPNLGSEWLECDGNIRNIADFPDLGAYLGATFGGDGVTTFKTPNLLDTGRFRRSRTGTLAAGTYQASAFKSHVHTATTASAGAHAHTATVTDPGHTHTVLAIPNAGNQPVLAQAASSPGAQQSGYIGSSFTGVTVAIDTQGAHTHVVTVAASSDGGDTETRPEAFVVYVAIKT